MTRKLLAATALLLMVLGCDKYKAEYNKAFVESWRTSFITSCAPDGSPPEQTDLCTCVADKAIVEMTVPQLSDAAFATKYVTDTLIPACQGP